MKKIILMIFILVSYHNVFSQNKDVEVGSRSLLQNRQGGYYDYSEPDALNMRVSVWGFVKYPGKYLIPQTSSVSDLISYAGGPTDDAHLDELRIYRTYQDTNQVILKFNYNDAFWEEDLSNSKISVPELIASDIIMVPGSRRLYFDDWLRLSFGLLTTLISLATFIVVLSK